jgi:NADPH:quinone reductase-like Zn-dependent oxidoreductase
MRCVVFEKFGEPAEVLSLGEQNEPEPGPGQVRIRMALSPIHNHDLAIIRGIYGYKPALPAIPGTEAVGVVDRLGPGVAGIAAGQRVSVAGVNGAWAEYFLAKAAAVVPIPPEIPDQTACQLLAMPVSATMLIEDLELKAGDWMIQNAANGAVGRMVNTLAQGREIKVVNLVRRQSAVAELEAAGIPHVIATDDPGWRAKVAEATGGAPIIRAVDSVGGRAASQLMSVLARGGSLTSFGALSGEPLIIDVGHILFKETVVKGFWATSRAERTPPADYRRMIVDVIRLAVQGRLPLTVESTFPLAQAPRAATLAEKPGRKGKVALRGAE